MLRNISFVDITSKNIDIHYREYSLLDINSIKLARGNKAKETAELLEIEPSQLSNNHYDKNGWLCKRIRKYKLDGERRYFPKNITLNKLIGALEEANVNKSNYKICRHEFLIEYTYKGKPTIFLNTKNGKFFTSVKTIEKYDLSLIELQAYIIIEILKKSGYSICKRGKSEQIYGMKN